MTIESEFDLHDDVRIKELDRPGKVLSIYIAPKGIQYNVRYIYDGCAKEVYFFADELEKRNN